MATKTQRERRKRQMASPAAVQSDVAGKTEAFYKMPKGIPSWNPKKPGPYEIDIIPYEVGKRFLEYKRKPDGVKPGQWYPFRTFYVHYQVGPDRDQLLCPAANFGKPCPVCEHRNEVAQDPKSDWKKDIKPFQPKDRQLILIVDHAELDKGVQLWEVAPFNFHDQLRDKIDNASAKNKERYQKFFDPDEGSTLRLIAKQETMGENGRPFLWFSVDEFQERDTPLDDKLLDHGVCLDDLPNLLSYDQIRKLFYGVTEEEAPKGGVENDEGDQDGQEGDDQGAEAGEQGAEDGDGWGDQEENTPEIEVGSEVEFAYRGKQRRGTVTDINTEKGLAKVEVEGQDKPSVVKLEELTPVEVPGPGEESNAEAGDDGWGTGGDDGWGEYTPEPEPAPAKGGKGKKGGGKK